MGSSLWEYWSLIRGAEDNPLVYRYRPLRPNLSSILFSGTLGLGALPVFFGCFVWEPVGLVFLGFVYWPLVAAIHFLLLAPAPADKDIHTEWLMTRLTPREILFGYLFWPGIAVLGHGLLATLAGASVAIRAAMGDPHLGLWGPSLSLVTGVPLVTLMAALLLPVSASLALDSWSVRAGWRWFAALTTPVVICCWAITVSSLLLAVWSGLTSIFTGHESSIVIALLLSLLMQLLLLVWAIAFLGARVYRLESLVLSDLPEGISLPKSPWQESLALWEGLTRKRWWALISRQLMAFGKVGAVAFFLASLVCLFLVNGFFPISMHDVWHRTGAADLNERTLAAAATGIAWVVAVATVKARAGGLPEPPRGAVIPALVLRAIVPGAIAALTQMVHDWVLVAEPFSSIATEAIFLVLYSIILSDFLHAAFPLKQTLFLLFAGWVAVFCLPFFGYVQGVQVGNAGPGLTYTFLDAGLAFAPYLLRRIHQRLVDETSPQEIIA